MTDETPDVIEKRGPGRPRKEEAALNPVVPVIHKRVRIKRDYWHAEHGRLRAGTEAHVTIDEALAMASAGIAEVA